MTAARRSVAIPSASMADVAFLLLLFFLVTTSIRSDAGLPVTLPPAFDDGHTPVAAFFEVLVRPDGAVLLGGEVVPPSAVRRAVAGYVSRAERPRVMLQAHRATPYDAYIAALDAVLLGHRDADVPPRLTLREPAR